MSEIVPKIKRVSGDAPFTVAVPAGAYYIQALDDDATTGQVSVEFAGQAETTLKAGDVFETPLSPVIVSDMPTLPRTWISFSTGEGTVSALFLRDKGAILEFEEMTITEAQASES
jgi:hypothetical protein